MYATFERFSIQMTKREALTASHQGDCTEDVQQLVAMPKIRRQLDNLDPATIRAELAEYGAWDNLELSDDTANRERIIWLAACDIREEHSG